MNTDVESFGVRFILHCPVCGEFDFDDSPLQSSTHDYYRCKHCGAAVSSEPAGEGLVVGVIAKANVKKK
jgi:transposase-like protein